MSFVIVFVFYVLYEKLVTNDDDTMSIGGVFLFLYSYKSNNIGIRPWIRINVVMEFEVVV